MMGSAAAMLLNVASTKTTPGAGTEVAATEGMEMFAALLAGKSALPTAAPPVTEAVATPKLAEGEAADAASAELAAAVAAMLGMPVTAEELPGTPVGEGDATLLESSDASPTASNTASSDKALRQLLHTLSQQAAGQSDASAVDTQAATARATNPALSAPQPPRATEAVLATLAASVQQPELVRQPAETQPPSPTSPQPHALQLQSTQQAQSAAPAAEQTLHSRPGTPRWADELGQRMVLMTLRGQHEGSLNLTPEHLGPLEVRLSVNQGTANVWFGAQHAETRAALTEALPRLRELFGDAGLQLGHAGVSHEAPRQGSHEARAAGFSGSSDNALEATETVAPASRPVALGLVDTYA